MYHVLCYPQLRWMGLPLHVSHQCTPAEHSSSASSNPTSRRQWWTWSRPPCSSCCPCSCRRWRSSACSGRRRPSACSGCRRPSACSSRRRPSACACSGRCPSSCRRWQPIRCACWTSSVLWESYRTGTGKNAQKSEKGSSIVPNRRQHCFQLYFARYISWELSRCSKEDQTCADGDPRRRGQWIRSHSTD